ncbi:FAD-binding protein [Hymenobacter jejuensis]|uniref:FAD-binding protein n=1 Tax=Hymenobacter jejuensis TaxID=2502781 RepID=A0A5B8A3H8_9BACT|nr:FAD-binding protein [Hymenobacter jejuensis]QDA61737.1 FAD-binding protein [Hymenobacter jejuensis]
MALPNGIFAAPMTLLPNRHQNFEQPVISSACFKLRIPTGMPVGQESYHQTTANFQWLITYGITHKVRLRAMGSNWSFAKVAVTNGGIVDTAALHQSFGVAESMVAPKYIQAGGKVDNLWFTECGNNVISLERDLEKRGKSLRASGASNGQTIAGATSTGTHGAGFEVGAVHDTVVGLHLVCGPDRHVWLERESYPVASDAFTEWLGVTEVHRSDALFNAAIISFGSFGFIHGLLLEVSDKFLLEDYSSKRVPYNVGLKQAMTRLDFSGLKNVLGLPTPTDTQKPWHFQLIVNPHQFDANMGNPTRGAYVRILYHTPYRPIYPHRPPPKPGFTYGDDTMGIIQTVLDKLGAVAPLLVPAMVNKLYPLALDDTNGVAGTMSETFSNTNIRGKAASAAIGIAAADSPRVLEEIVDLNSKTPFPGILGLRYVKGTAATLGFTRFPITCVLELDGIEAKLTRDFFERIWNRLEILGISYTLHWGKLNFNLTAPRLRRMYGNAAVDSWLQARRVLLDAPTREVFTNGFMESCGLADAVRDVAPV